MQECCIHEEIVLKTKQKMIQEETLYDLAELFKVFGDTTRIKIISVLKEQELCVGDLSAVLNISISAISHQLRVLKHAKIVKPRREGKMMYYSLDDEHINKIFAIGLEHIIHKGK